MLDPEILNNDGPGCCVITQDISTGSLNKGSNELIWEAIWVGLERVHHRDTCHLPMPSDGIF